MFLKPGLPLVYSDKVNVPFMFGYSDSGLSTNHNVSVGKKIRRAFIYDRMIISENRSLLLSYVPSG